jgi:hypothetical protein
MDKTQFLIHPQVGNGKVGLVRRLLKVAGRVAFLFELYEGLLANR